MAAYFSLTPNGETKPQAFVEVDEAICAHLQVPVHPTQWYRDWYNNLGLTLATGGGWRGCREYFPELEDIIAFLETNYQVDAWAGR